MAYFSGGEPPHEMTTAERVASQSQDFVDEKELEYLQTIQLLADEQERVQKKTFVNWINSYLAQHIPPLRIDNLIEDIRDGTRLIALLEVLSGERLPVEKGRILRRPHFLSNVNTALQFLERKRVKLVNINASDVVDGRHPVVLGLVWTIILFFQIEENTRLLAEQMARMRASSMSSLESAASGSESDVPSKWSSPSKRTTASTLAKGVRSGARKALMQWVKNVIPRKYGILITDFGSTWRDGHAFLALISSIRPDLVDWDSMRNATNHQRLETAFNVAQRELGIARLLDAEDVDVYQPDEKSIMTYVAQFLHKYPEFGTAIQAPEPLTITDLEKSEYDDLCKFLCKAETALQNRDKNLDRNQEYSQFYELKTEMNKKYDIYEQVRLKVESRVSTFVTSEMWSTMERRWTYVEEQLRYWQRQLDANLPSAFAPVIQWLHRAEDLLRSEILPPGMTPDVVAFVAKLLEEHKNFFRDMSTIQKQFNGLCDSQVAESIPAAHLQDLQSRLDLVAEQARQRQLRLEYEEQRLQTATIINRTQQKLQIWTVKYGFLQTVEKLLNDYKDCVDTNNIFVEFDKAYDKLQRASDMYKKDGTYDPREIEAIGRFLKEVNEQWRAVTVDLQCMRSMLEQVIYSWETFGMHYDRFREWLDRAEMAANGNEDERMEFFQDLNAWKDVYTALHESGTFLQSACEDHIAIEIHQKMIAINQRWDYLITRVQEYMVAGELTKHRYEYRSGLHRIQEWIAVSEELLSTDKTCCVDVLQALVQQLQSLQHQGDDMENLFKLVSKKAQGLIQEISREDVDKMMIELKRVKEALVFVRATVPTRLTLYHQLLTQQEALEKGIAEIGQWLDEAEALLSSHSIDRPREVIQENLERHRNFFSRLVYYRSMLESKNKVYQSIIKSLNGSHGVETESLKLQVQQLNWRFQNVVGSARKWEQRMEELLSAWQFFREGEEALMDWLAEATRLFQEKLPDNRKVIEQHKKFFAGNGEPIFQGMLDSAQDLCTSLPVSEHVQIKTTVTTLQSKWQEVVSYIPLHLLKLEFRLDETTFQQYIRDIEKQLNLEQTQFNHNENIGVLLQNHEEYFDKSGVVSKVTTCLAGMERLASDCWRENPADSTVPNSTQQCRQQWQQLLQRIEDMHTQLQHIPGRWKEYRDRFEAMQTWMDKVDTAIGKLSEEAEVMEEFEELRTKFQRICEEVDAHRIEMKWLVQTLDALVSHSSDEEATHEQKRLESLIGRYKSLLPNIEVTTVRVDTVSKCFLYREEVQEIISWLREKQDQSARDGFPDSINRVNEMIKHQESILKQLEEQRSKVLGKVQHGRDLQRDPNAPAFLKYEVQGLEDCWKEAFNQTTSKLNQLKGTHKIWSDYDEQKAEIFRLLKQAEEELRKMSGPITHPTIQKELRAKQDLSMHLREATEAMLKKLHELSSSLADRANAQHRPILEKEVTEIERRLQVVMSTVQERIVYMEQITIKWTSYTLKIDEFSSWVNNANQRVDAIKLTTDSPDAKMNQVKDLRHDFAQKLTILGHLEREGAELITAEPNSDQSRALQAQLTDLRREMDILKTRLAALEKVASDELNHWQRYHSSRQDLEPWLVKAENRVSQGQPRPSTLQEAKELLQQNRLFQRECEDRGKQLTALLHEGEQVDAPQKVVGELDLLETRWQSVRDTVTQWVQAGSALITDWTKLSGKLIEMDGWLEQQRAELDEPYDADTPDVEDLEDQMEELKKVNRDTVEKQSQVISLVQECDCVCPHVSHDCANALRSEVSTIKTQVAEFLESGRGHQAALADIIISRQEFWNRFSAFQSSLQQLEQKLNQLNEVYADRVEQALDTIKSLKNEVQDLQPIFNYVYEEVKKLNSACAVDDVRSLNSEFSLSSERYQVVQDLLDLKQRLFDRWLEFHTWQIDVTEQLRLHEQCLEAKRVSPADLQKTTDEVSALAASLPKMQTLATEIQDLMKQSRTVIKDRSSGWPHSPQQQIVTIQKSAHTLQMQLGLKEEQLERLGSQRDDFENARQNLESYIKSLEERIEKIQTTQNSPEGLAQMLQSVEVLLNEMNQRQDDRNRLHEKGRTFLQADASQYGHVQTILSQIDATWERLSLSLVDRHAQLGSVLSLWQNCVAIRCELTSTIQDAKEFDRPLDPAPTDIHQVQTLLDKAKFTQLTFTKLKSQVDQYHKKASQVSQQLSTIPGFDPESLQAEAEATCQRWQQLSEAISNRVQNLEGQLVLWHHIEQSKELLVTWLTATSTALEDSMHHIGGTTSATSRVEKYRNELPTYEQTHQGLLAKTESLEKLNEGRPISTLYAMRTMLESQFAHVEQLARSLEGTLGVVAKGEAAVLASIQRCLAWLSAAREQLNQLDNMSGDDQTILDRLQETKKLEGELQTKKAEITQIEEEVKELKVKFETCDVSHLNKDISGLTKRFEALEAQTSKIGHNLHSLLEKRIQSLVQELQRWLSGSQEKVSWCNPDLASDRYSLEAKLTMLQEIEGSLNAGEDLMRSFHQLAAVFQQVASEQRFQEIDAFQDQLAMDWNRLMASITETRERLMGTLQLWQTYETNSEALAAWLKELETKVRSETSAPPQPSLASQQSSKLQAIIRDIEIHSSDFATLATTSEQLQAASPDSRATSYSSQLTNRHQTVLKTAKDYWQRLQQLSSSQDDYRNAVERFQAWMRSAEEELQTRSTVASTSDKAVLSLKGKLKKLKELLGSKDEGQTQLSAAFDCGEALYPTISAEGRESIRSELRCLRDSWEGYWDRVNRAIKKLEIALMQWDSFDDNCRQVRNWLDETQAKVGADVHLQPTLHDKKLSLQNYKSVAQDIASHAVILQQLVERAQEFMDEGVQENLQNMQDEYQVLSVAVKDRIKRCEQYVIEHEQYQHSVEKFRDWLSTIQAELQVLSEADDMSQVEVQLAGLQTLQQYQEEGPPKLKELEKRLGTVSMHTDPPGHPALRQELESLKQDWESFLTSLETTRQRLETLQIQSSQCSKTVEVLMKWLQSREMQVKEVSLKPYLETKRAQLEKLQSLSQEVTGKQGEMIAACSEAQSLEADSKLLVQVAQMNSRYQSLCNNVKDTTVKWEGYVKDHDSFNTSYEQFQSQLGEAEVSLAQYCAINGDMKALGDKKTKLENMVEQRNTDTGKLEGVLDLGERLYPHTATDGREVIRQQLRSLRDRWDSFGEKLLDGVRLLDQCLNEFDAFTRSQGQLTLWLREIEHSMEQTTELKSSLQEKQAQLQNHKIVHQEILSHRPLVENVCERAQHLVQQTGDKSLHVYITSIQKLYGIIGEKSQDLLAKLDVCAQDHQLFINKSKDIQHWLNRYRDQLQLLSDVTGDKTRLFIKQESLMDLRKTDHEADEMLDNLSRLGNKVASSSSSHGAEMLQQEVASLRDSWTSAQSSAIALKSTLDKAVKQWQAYEKGLQDISNWCQTSETQLRDMPLRATLPEKRQQLMAVQARRDDIVQYEKEVDRFSDKAHTLLQASSVDVIRSQVAQVSSRFQSLLAISKDQIGKWQTLVEDHEVYTQRLSEVNGWLDSLENMLQALDSETDMEERLRKLQLVVIEKERGSSKLNSTTVLGERLYPDTATAGRDTIRQELRTLRDRWDRLDTVIDNQQKMLENQNQQWLQYNEGLQQLLNWLDVMEKALQAEQSSWSTLQEAKGRLLRYKTLQQDVLSHKRMVDGIREKAESLRGAAVSETVDNLTSRYDNLCSSIRNVLARLESVIEELHVYYDLQQAMSEWQKTMWDHLAMYTDYTGNKQVLQGRLVRIKKVQDRLAEGQASLASLSHQAEKILDKLPPRSKEVIDREFQTIKHDYEKLGSTIEDVHRSLDNRIQQWTQYDEDLDKLLRWLTDTEAALKEFAPKSTLPEKEEQLMKYKALIGVIEAKSRSLQDFYSVAESLEQNLMSEVRSTEKSVDQLRDTCQDLMHVSGELRLSVGAQQVSSRYQSLQITCKEVVKKCEQHVNHHRNFQQKYEQCFAWLRSAQDKMYACSEAAGDRAQMDSRHAIVKTLLQEQGHALSLLNATSELGEALYASTATEGREVLHAQLQDLQAGYEALFDNLATADQSLRSSLSTWSSFEENLREMQRWVQLVQTQLGDNLHLHATLDDKKTQLQVYRVILHDILSHQQVIAELKQQSQNLTDKDDSVDETLNKLWNSHQEYLQKAQLFVETYEQFVAEHQQYTGALSETEKWLATNKTTVSSFSDATLERISLQSNLERLKTMLSSLKDEDHRITKVKSLSDKVLAGSSEIGQQAIQKEIDDTQQEWLALMSLVNGLIATLENQVSVWADYERCLDECGAWLKDIDTKLHTTDLKATLAEKKSQLDLLKGLQGEVRAKELEIDAVTERAHQLYQAAGGHRGSVIAELGIRYQQVITRIKDLVTKWQQYVINHQDYESQMSDCKSWLQEVKTKLARCSDLSASSRSDLENKLATIQDLLLYKEEGYLKVQSVVEQAQMVLSNTAHAGHEPINFAIVELQEEWSTLASKMVETKVTLDDLIHKWSGFLENIHQLLRTVENLEAGVQNVAQHQTTMSEKRAQIEMLKGLSEKVACERMEVDSLRSKADELAASKQQEHAASQAHDILSRFMAVDENIKVLSSERDQHYKDHRAYKAACDDVITWINNLREKLPLFTRSSLGDRLALESAVSNLDQLLGKRTQGQLKVDHMFQTGEVVLASTSSAGQDLIIAEMKSLQGDFEGLFKEIEEQKNRFEQICVQWRGYKDEYEHVSDWLQITEAELKEHKTTLRNALEEKYSSMNQCKELLNQLEKGQETMDNLNQMAQILLSSHLDTYVNNQLRHLNSRYQVITNLAKDVLKKVEQNYEHFQNYQDNCTKARSWIENARQIVKECSYLTNGKDTSGSANTQLSNIQDLLLKQDEGQTLVSNAVSWGEKAVRTTRAEGRVTINRTLQEIQTDWDRLVKKMSNAKVSLETSMLQWTDYSSSYKHLQQWLSEREEKLQEVIESKVGVTKGLPERKANLRKTNSLVQDIVSFEPMIESVSYKAEELLQKSPQSKLTTDATEITSKYQNLTKQAQEILEEQKKVVEQHQAFMDASNEFNQWLRSSRESLNKCVEAVGDKEMLLSKNNQVKLLLLEEDTGAAKLRISLDLGDKALNVGDKEEQLLIAEEMALLQEEFDQYKKLLGETKTNLEVGLVKWTEYEELYKQCCEWLVEKDGEVQGYLKLQTDLNGKRMLLERFQVLLQTIFDWQCQLDRLNSKGHLLLEVCSDSRVSNAITQLTTRYNALLSLAKEVMRRLEQNFQEHQQQQCIYSECVEWIDKTRDRLTDNSKPTSSIDELNNQLQTLKNLKTSMEQGQHKLRYALELKEKIILNTDAAGAAKIQENTDNMQQEFEKLVADISKARHALVATISKVEDHRKTLRLFSTWLQEMEEKVNADGAPLADELGERRAVLEKYRSIQREIIAHEPAATQLSEKLRDEQSQQPVQEVADYVDRYRSLVQKVGDRVRTLESQVAQHEQYRSAQQDASDWLLKLQMDIQDCCDCTGERQILEDKCKKLKELIDCFGHSENLVKKAEALAESILPQTGTAGQEIIRQELEQLQIDLERVGALSKTAKDNLDQCMDYWATYDQMYGQQSQWLAEFQQKVNKEVETAEKEKSQEDLEKYKHLMDEANEHESTMSDLSDTGETLMELSSCSRVGEQTVQLLSSYSSIVNMLQGLLVKVEKCVAHYGDYLKVKDDFNDWMSKCNMILDANSNVSGDEDELQTHLDALKAMSAQISEGQQLLHTVSEMGTRALNTIPAATQDLLRAEMASLHRGWEAFTLRLSQSLSRIKASISRLQEYTHDFTKLEVWLSGVEARLDKPMGIPGNVVEMKTQIERYKHIQTEIESKSRDFKSVQSEAEELTARTGDGSLQETITELKKKYESLLQRCKDLITRMGNDLQDFQQYQFALQETEKWMLHTSFQLMTHNSLYINSLDQTQELLGQHEIVLAEVKSYQTTLDDVKVKGNMLIDKYQDTANNICTEIQQQMTNIQESYDALFKTAHQILKRLQDSVQKFKEYEDALDIITENLNSIEPELAKEQGVTPLNLEDAKNHQNSVRNISNKLNIEKQRLQAAVQACEDATASLSRPSSPEAGIPSMMPEKETFVRLRLEDLIDQAENAQMTISRNVNEWEELERCREELRKWLSEQEGAVINFKSKPARLRQEVAQGEINQIQYLKTQVDEKRQVLEDIEQRQQNLSPDYEDTSLREELDQLEAQVIDLLETRQRIQNNIDDYRQLLSRQQAWFDQIGKQLELVDRGDGLDNVQKAEKLKELLQEFESQQILVEEMRNRGSDAIPELSGMDAQQVEEQLKSTNKKFSELQKRVQRKAQVVDLIKEGSDSLNQDITSTREWLHQKIKFLDDRRHLGYRSAAVEARIQDVNALKREMDNKTVIIETIERQVESIVADLEGYERDQLRQPLKTLQEDFQKLKDAVRKALDHLAVALAERQKFERTLESVRQWLTDKSHSLSRSSTESTPLQVPMTEKIVETVKRLDTDVKNYDDSIINELRKQAQNLSKECNDQDKDELKTIILGVENQLKEIKGTLQEYLHLLLDQLQKRQAFEDALNKCKHWLHQAEVSLSGELRMAATIDVVEEQLQKYTTLLNEAGTVSGDISSVTQKGLELKPEVSESDQLSLQGQLDNLRDKHNRLASTISDRVSALEKMVNSRHHQETEMHDSISVLTELQSQLRILNRPIGHSVKEAQELLDSYQIILAKLRELQDKLEQLQKLSANSSADLEALLRSLHEHLQQVEAQIAKLKQIILVREHFHALIAELQATINKYTEIVGIIERSEATVTDKIRRYQEVLQKLTECDAQLMTAMDKGQQIGAEGSAIDRNFIMEQLQSLKMQLNNLRRMVEKKKSEHEVLAAELNKLRQELEETLDRLHDQEGQVKSRPLLTLDPVSVNEELRKHKLLSQEIHSLLSKLQVIRERLQHEHEADLLPAVIHEHLSEAKLLASTLPSELDEAERYLREALQLRQQFHDLYERLASWIELALTKLHPSHEGIDFENIVHELQEHKVFFKDCPAQMQRMQQLQELASKITPSLRSNEQGSLYQDLAHREKQLNDVMSSSNKRQSALEADAQAYGDYHRALDKASLILDGCDFGMKTLDTLAAVAACLQRMADHNRQIQKHQEMIDDFREKARGLERRADYENCSLIKTQVENVCQRWRDICHQVECQQVALQEVHERWDRFVQLASQLNTAITTKEQQLQALSQKTLTKAQLDVFSDQLKALEAETLELQSTLSNVHVLSSGVLVSNSVLSDTARKSIKDETNNLSARYAQLCEAIQQKLRWIQEELSNIDNLEGEVISLKIALENMQSDIERLDVYDPDEETVERTLQQMKDHVQGLGRQVHTLSEGTQSRYAAVQQAVPTEVSRQLSSLELLSETVSAGMEDREREFKRARTTRYDYVSDMEAVQYWLQQADVKLHDKTSSVPVFKENVQKLQSEIDVMNDRLIKVNKNGHILCEKTQNVADQELVRTTLATLNDQMQRVRNLIDDRRTRVDEAQEAWQRFLQAQAALNAWLDKTRAFLAVGIQFTSLTHTKQKLAEYQAVLKDCPQAQRYLTEMTKELASITQVCSAGDLPDKLSEADLDKSTLEKRVQEQVALLQEMTEEWEQCEKKVREVTTWLEKARQNLESTQNKKKPLREQLTMREKMLADITIQKAKLQMSLEKLGVHLRDSSTHDNQIVMKSESLQQELDSLQAFIIEQNHTLEASITQVEQYQQEILRLKTQVTQAEHQLRVVSSPTYSPRDRKKQLSEQTACREKIKQIQEKIAAVNDRTKVINQRGTPDTDPLYSSS